LNAVLDNQPNVMARSNEGPQSRKLVQVDYEALAQFRYLMRKFVEFSAVAARNCGLTPQQHQALLAIQGFPGGRHVAVGTLAERLGVRHHSVVGLVDRLANRGLVCRTRDAIDGRRVWLRLTLKGRRLLSGLSLVHREELRRLGATLKRLLPDVR
jgi:DNA-binding MarR family transcriptional regulator